MVHKRKQIEDLQTDLEVINPIESKKILGGDWYTDRWTDARSDGNGGMILTFHEGSNGNWASGAGTFGGTYDPFYDGSYTSDWYNYGNDNTGGGGDSGSNPIILQNIPASVPQQIGNMCTFESFAFTSNLLGTNTTLDTISTQLSQNQNIGYSGVMNGLTVLQYSIAISNLFHATLATSITDIQDAIGKGNPTLAFFNGHAVTIVGYDSTNQTFNVADSQWATNNGYHDISESSINISNAYIVTGTRP